MRGPAKVAAFACAVGVALGGGALVGELAGPIDAGAEASDGHGGGHDTAAAAAVGGLAVSDRGYTLVADDRVLDADRVQPFAFTITDVDGTAVQQFDVRHDRELHLIVVSRDLGTFAHVHPERDADGVWHVDLPALAAGPYRAFADFQPTGGPALTLGIDLAVPGEVAAPTPLEERRTDTVDGYTVTLAGDVASGGSSEVVVTVERDGAVVTTEPYLGAAGHLVAIRDGDLGYLHVHPIDETPSGPVRFGVETPGAGTYGLYFDFAHEGVVRTAHFVVTADGHDADDRGHEDGDPADGHPADDRDTEEHP